MRNRTDAKIVENIRAFIRHHPTRAYPREAQDAIDAIIVAKTFDSPENKVSLFQVSDYIGVTRQKVNKNNGRETEMQSASLNMGPRTRMRPYD